LIGFPRKLIRLLAFVLFLENAEKLLAKSFGNLWSGKDRRTSDGEDFGERRVDIANSASDSGQFSFRND
jgi:hypothetical protein